MDEAKQQRAQAMLERRRAAEERIERALVEAAAKQQKILTDFEQKTRDAQQRAAAGEAALRKQLADEAKARDAKHAHKRETKERALREEEERVQRLLSEANSGDEVMAENKAKRDREIALRKLDHDLKLADKVEICNSYQRAQEYQRFLVRAPRAGRHATPATCHAPCTTHHAHHAPRTTHTTRRAPRAAHHAPCAWRSGGVLVCGGALAGLPSAGLRARRGGVRLAVHSRAFRRRSSRPCARSRSLHSSRFRSLPSRRVATRLRKRFRATTRAPSAYGWSASR
jgi:hypothetical protein